MSAKRNIQDSHLIWLEDPEYRKEYGAESAKSALGVALFEAREAAGLSRAELAERAGVLESYITKLEQGESNPSIGNIGKLLACMGLKILMSVGALEDALINNDKTEEQGAQ